ncbi:hypothetical protein THIARS_70682 [Thiomonas delicata]|uniref:Uncharacterized protein n=1 Tax=Thiomonas delicata TaxID=364030 RepID=A0A238D7A4_THIDL|nr:hypothetical protein THIARS_70682 [Thiomonas delicata]
MHHIARLIRIRTSQLPSIMNRIISLFVYLEQPLKKTWLIFGQGMARGQFQYRIKIRRHALSHYIAKQLFRRLLLNETQRH